MRRCRPCTVWRLLGLLILLCASNMTWMFYLHLTEMAPTNQDGMEGFVHLLHNVTARLTTPDVQYLNMLNRLPIQPRGLRITGTNNSVAQIIRDKIRRLLSPRQNMVLFSEFDANSERCNLSRPSDKNCFGTTPVKHHRACAVVGSSGILLNSSCGNEIDSHDYVIRFNLVPIVKHATNAGMKSNLTVMNVFRLRSMVKRMESGSRRAWERFERINNSLIIYPKRLSRASYQFRRYSELLELFRNRSRDATNRKRKVYLPLLYSITDVQNITTDLINEIYDYPGFHSPTVGLMTSLLALSFCDHVTLYGFYPLATDAHNRTIQFHYHDDPLPGEGRIVKPHLFNVEYDFIRNLHRVNNFRSLNFNLSRNLHLDCKTVPRHEARSSEPYFRKTAGPTVVLTMTAVLGYWKIRAYGQSIRLLLEHTGTDYKEDVYVCGGPPDFSKDCWRSIKDNFGLAFPNLPYYVDGDVKMTHSMAIMRHLGRKNNLYAESEEEHIRQDMLEQEVVDFRGGFYKLALQAKDIDSEKLDYLKELPKSLERFSSFLGEKSWFVSEKLTYVDFLMYEHLDQHRVLEPTCLHGFKNLQEFMDRFEALPRIAEYLKSDRFSVHPICNPMAKFSNKSA